MQLRELVRFGILYKKVYQQIPLKVEYHLSETGTSVLPVIEAIGKWGNEKRKFILMENSIL